MLTQSGIERERYEARRKAQLDHESNLKEERELGRAEGAKIGREEGAKIGLIRAIHTCQRLLKLSETPRAQLAAQSVDDLTRMANELEATLLNKSGG